VGEEANERVVEKANAVLRKGCWWGVSQLKSGVRKDRAEDKKQSQLNVMDGFWVHNICQSTAGWMVISFADDQTEAVWGCDTAKSDV
jgi:hypothetical protein